MKFFGISVNSATLASEKCHYCKAKQPVLTFKIGTIPVLKCLRSDSTSVGRFLSELHSALNTTVSRCNTITIEVRK